MTVVHRPRLLSDNGASYVATDLAQWLDRQEMDHVRGAPYHPQTQGKIERWHQTLKNRILLEHYYLPRDLERQVATFVAHYNHARYHESLDNLTPADVYFGRAETILLERERIKRQTIANRRLQHQLHAAQSQSQMIQSLPSGSRQYVSNHLTTDKVFKTFILDRDGGFDLVKRGGDCSHTGCQRAVDLQLLIQLPLVDHQTGSPR
jgi:hypothetical protein